MRNLLFILLMLSLSACSTIGYYTQSVSGQLSILFKRQDINDLIADEETPTELQNKLRQAIEIRQFASQELGLPDNKSYLYYTDLQRPYVVWNVFAAPEFSLRPKTWCYFIVGCVSYRGYFDQQDAVKTAEALKKQHYDVHVAGIAAYSTLGWFDDPLLNTMMHWRIRNLASLMFHEISHQVIYIASETAFNEAFSTAVERLGTIQWLLHHHPESLQRYLDYLTAQQDFRQLLLDTRQQLENLYESGDSESNMRSQKTAIIAELKSRYQQQKLNWQYGIHFDNWFKLPINNARLTSTMTYLQKVPAFYQLFAENQANWPDFYQAVIDMDNMDKADRDTLIQQKIISAPEIRSLVTLIKNKHLK